MTSRPLEEIPFVTDTRLDVLAIGDAIVDVIAPADDEFLIAQGLPKGSMRLIDAQEATSLYALMGQARETSGGSAANTMAGLASLGARAGFVGQVASDQLGEIFAHDIRAQGVEFQTPPSGDGVPTGRCLILVTPDAQRTMNTFPGAAHRLSVHAIVEEQVQSCAILYLEAYLWRPEGPREAMRKAVEIAHGAGRKVALTLSDIACIASARQSFLDIIAAGRIDMLFGNENEIMALAGTGLLDDAIAAFQDKVPLMVVTCSEKGAVAVENGNRIATSAKRIDGVVDTTGAGDLFAAGFLAGQAQGRPLGQRLEMGALAAAEIISHFGARPEVDLKALVEERLGR